MAGEVAVSEESLWITTYGLMCTTAIPVSTCIISMNVPQLHTPEQTLVNFVPAPWGVARSVLV